MSSRLFSDLQNRDPKQARRQRDDGDQNHLVKISYSKGSLFFIIHRIRMKSIQLMEHKFGVAHVAASKGRRCAQDEKIRGFAL